MATTDLENSSYTSDHDSAQDAKDHHWDEDRDEVKEVRRFAERETARIQCFRIVVAFALVATGLAVTLTTYYSLSSGESDKFQRAFNQYSLTIAEAAKNRQTSIDFAYKSVADMISSGAVAANATWPFYTFPRFEQLAFNARYQSKTEIMLAIHRVRHEDRKQWLDYAEKNHEQWAFEGFLIESKREGDHVFDNFRKSGYISDITRPTANGSFVPSEEKEEYWPGWSYSPPPFTYSFVNFDLASVPDYVSVVEAALQLKNQTLFTRVRRYESADIALTKEKHASMHSVQFAHLANDLPHSMVVHPIHKDPDDHSSEVVAIVGGGSAWDAALLGILPDDAKGIIVVISNNCEQSFTFQIDGVDAFYLGEGDHHDTRYDNMVYEFDTNTYTNANYDKVGGHCIYRMHIYPSRQFEEAWISNSAPYTAAILGFTFAIVILVFLVYDTFVKRRNEKLIENAARTNAIVSSLFPSTFRDKLVGVNGSAVPASGFIKGSLVGTPGQGTMPPSSAPLADLFLETSIMFADIVGFTAWASVRQPSHVFTLLETLYSAFDAIAKARRVFKVETVGDCYVAATGIPVQSKDHAVVICRFARDIIKKTSSVTKELEIALGPDTADLVLRIGIHSGPVTAGVLRGDKARFQLFGDTMNMTARIESTGQPGRIHLSSETADILTKGGKGHWVQKRDDFVEAKGKGLVQTYWLNIIAENRGSCASQRSGSEQTDSNDDELPPANLEAEKIQRLVDWNTECLQRSLKQIVALRASKGCIVGCQHIQREVQQLEHMTITSEGSYLDEVKEIISLPDFHGLSVLSVNHPDDVELPSEVVHQLKDYVTCISSMYRDNPFHNFEHASHVTMSVLKLLSRIVAPTDIAISDATNHDYDAADEGGDKASTLHDHTYGITSDPLTHFACAFSALIHDVDHTGAPNAQLVKEGAVVASVYHGRSVAEQNSLALAWDLLMDGRFQELRHTIYADAQELQRFRQLVVNAVMATDIVDKDLKALRNNRWEKAFSQNPEMERQETMDRADKRKDAINRKATIVIEHLIQASDVAHTMQHWHIYRKWNERFFRECYIAYISGRGDRNPAETWFEGEIGFFDYYIIPLAKKLKDCGVFGKSSDEYLNYALKNRAEWDVRGKEIVSQMFDEAESDYGGRKA